MNIKIKFLIFILFVFSFSIEAKYLIKIEKKEVEVKNKVVLDVSDITAKDKIYTVSQSYMARYGVAGTYDKFTTKCVNYSTGKCLYTRGYNYLGSFIGESNNPTYYIKFNEKVSISNIEFSGFSYNHSSYGNINFKYKNDKGEWIIVKTIKDIDSKNNLNINNYSFNKEAISTEFAIESIIQSAYFNINYFKVIN